MNKYWLALLTTTLAVPAVGYERQHGSHVHGAATMQLVIEADVLQLQLETPAMNILGFEHAPSTAEQRKTVEQATTLLNNPENVVMLPAAAQCHLTQASIENSLADKDDEHHDHDEEHHDNDDEHHDHDEEHHDYDEEHHDHDEEHHDHDDEHHDHDEEHHDHDEEHHDPDEAGHSEYDLSYQFKCDNISALQQVDVKLFSHFPRLEELEVQYIVPLETGFGQGVKHLSAAEPQFKF
ncbi:DUF2796 domain-containing protein [Amphritea sp. 1_MG-2023]|uniref:ZrgA family zinc uptake protein n=1 Tax=Amphritea sp. 1_MG-2023 TaxID=3062670 RepID=UPI0026E22212|nr:DUF2796 domain-containing protein [Amphritea sp. 1_MG-2023]MDO6564327.1 DUF2796 domain-containing protein [Amphritea sp. 1_MG-2023]